MDTAIEGRREVAREILKLAEQFETSDRAAFRRMRIVCWGVTGIATVIALVLLLASADWRYVLASWAVIVGLAWLDYWHSTRRQRHQISRLRELAMRWLDGVPGARP